MGRPTLRPDSSRSAALGMTIFLICATAIAGQDTIVLLPFCNVSGAEVAPSQVSTLMAAALKQHGWIVADPKKVDDILEQERVRYLDSLDPELVARLLDATGAQALVSGTVYEYADTRNPIVAISGRMIGADGEVLWTDLAAMSSDDTEHVLGFGRKTLLISVAGETVQRLTRKLPDPGLHPALVRGPTKPLFRSSPASYRSRDLAGTRQRVCVLPFDNASSVPEAGRVVTDVVALRLAASKGFAVVEPETLRAAALQARIGSFRGIATEDLARLAIAVGTPLFVRGTVYNFVDPGGRPGAVPDLQIELSLVDVNSGKALWIAQHARKGTDYIGFLMLGNVSNVVSLTDRVVSEMIDAEERATPGRSDEKNAHAVRGRLAGVRGVRGQTERAGTGDGQR